MTLCKMCGRVMTLHDLPDYQRCIDKMRSNASNALSNILSELLNGDAERGRIMAQDWLAKK